MLNTKQCRNANFQNAKQKHHGATHGSPWTYDSYVPIFFASNGIPSQRIVRPVTPYDIAATIATCLEIKASSGSVGIPLVEVLKKK